MCRDPRHSLIDRMIRYHGWHLSADEIGAERSRGASEKEALSLFKRLCRKHRERKKKYGKMDKSGRNS